MCYLRQKNVAEVSPDVLIAANPGFPARNWNPPWKCWPMFWTFWGKILIFSGVARPLRPNHYPDILEERLICCVVFRQRSLIRTHRELGKSSPEEDRCTSLLVPHITVSCGFFFAKMSQQSQTTKPTCSLTNILDLSWLPLGRKGHQGINRWRRLGSFRWFLILSSQTKLFQDIVYWRQISSIFDCICFVLQEILVEWMRMDSSTFAGESRSWLLQREVGFQFPIQLLLVALWNILNTIW